MVVECTKVDTESMGYLRGPMCRLTANVKGIKNDFEQPTTFTLTDITPFPPPGG